MVTGNVFGHIFTGCGHNGTKAGTGGTPRPLGAAVPRVGLLDSADGGPLSSNTSTLQANKRPFYGLSPIFTVAQAGLTSDSGLIPSGLGVGDTFRLVFISSTTRDASSTSIDDYNTFVQTLAAAGHADIQPHSSLFRAVGCTNSTNATANTNTRAADTSVPIFWLNGAKAADDYDDFYDGSWDNEAEEADRDEFGINSVVTGNVFGHIFTGCDHNGRKAGTGTPTLGEAAPRLGLLDNADGGPLSSNTSTLQANKRPFYGLSPIFAVGAPGNNPPVFDPAAVIREVAENTATNQNVGNAVSATDEDDDTLEYSLGGADGSAFDIVAASGQIVTKDALNYEGRLLYSVTVTANDGTDTATATVSIVVLDVNEPPGQLAAPSVSATANSDTSIDVGWTAPNNTGPAIDSYDLQYRSTEFWETGLQDISGTSVAIPGLDADTLYEVQVRATNAEGDSLWSPSGSGRTSTPVTLPDPVACSTDSDWTSEMTAGFSSISTFPPAVIELSGYYASDSFGALNPSTFSIGVTNYTVTQIRQQKTREGTTVNTNILVFTVTGGTLPDGTVVTLNGTAFTIGTDTETMTTGSEQWNLKDLGITLDWVQYQKVSVCLTFPATTTVPGPPTGLTATTNGATRIDLAWTAPTDTGGAAITGYRIEVSDAGSSWSDLAPDTGSTTTTGTHAGLSAGTTRHYRVSAINSAGTGNPSNEDSATTVSAPSRPRNVITTAGNSQATVIWNASRNDGGAPLDCYQIRRKKTADTDYGNWGTCRGGSGGVQYSALITGLDNGTEYSFQVRARNSAGLYSVESAAATVTPRAFPGQPRSLNASGGNGQVMLSWTAPSSDGGAAITSYEYRYKTTGGYGGWSTVSGGGAARRATVTGLANDTPHTFQVRARNSAGAGVASNEATATPTGTTTTTEPGPPRSLNASGGDGRVTLDWTAPSSDGGAAITSYEYRYKTTGGYGGWSTVSGGGAARSVTVTGLNNDTPHTFQVRAVNNVGDGPATETTATPTYSTGGNRAPYFNDCCRRELTVGNVPANSLVGTVPAIDPDGDPLRYSLESAYERHDDKVFFTVGRTTGAIRTAVSFDYQTRTRLNLTLRAEDDGGLSATIHVHITHDPHALVPEGAPGSIGTLGSPVPGSDTSIKVIWSAPRDPGRSPVTHYDVRYAEVVDAYNLLWIPGPQGVTGESATITGLTPGTAYVLSARAVNAQGAGPWGGGHVVTTSGTAR